jgi:hypothetical protein
MEKVVKPTGKILFREVQQYRQAWLWVLLIGCSMVAILMPLMLIPAEKDMSGMNKLLMILVAVGIPLTNLAAFYFTGLETVVTNEGIFYRWRPYFRKYSVLRWSAIKEVSSRKYPYFQYGYHRRSGYGRVHNINGDKGIQLVLGNSQMIYLGSQRIDALCYSISQVRSLQEAYQ